MSTSDHEKPTALPAPISLTLEEALQVAGGAVPTSNPLLHNFIINGIPWPELIRPASIPSEVEQTINQVAGLAH